MAPHKKKKGPTVKDLLIYFKGTLAKKLGVALPGPKGKKGGCEEKAFGKELELGEWTKVS